jgi:hypothetical protein
MLRRRGDRLEITCEPAGFRGRWTCTIWLYFFISADQVKRANCIFSR